VEAQESGSEGRLFALPVSPSPPLPGRNTPSQESRTTCLDSSNKSLRAGLELGGRLVKSEDAGEGKGPLWCNKTVDAEGGLKGEPIVDGTSEVAAVGAADRAEEVEV
jgi:hypothetical protein